MGYVDTNYVGDLDNRRSMTGYALIFVGGLISWKSIRQSTINFPTTEAEYMTITEVSKEALWLKDLIRELGFEQGVVQLQSDSQSAMYLVKYQCFMRGQSI